MAVQLTWISGWWESHPAHRPFKSYGDWTRSQKVREKLLPQRKWKYLPAAGPLEKDERFGTPLNSVSCVRIGGHKKLIFALLLLIIPWMPLLGNPLLSYNMTKNGDNYILPYNDTSPLRQWLRSTASMIIKLHRDEANPDLSFLPFTKSSRNDGTLVYVCDLLKFITSFQTSSEAKEWMETKDALVICSMNRGRTSKAFNVENRKWWVYIKWPCFNITTQIRKFIFCFITMRQYFYSKQN